MGEINGVILNSLCQLEHRNGFYDEINVGFYICQSIWVVIFALEHKFSHYDKVEIQQIDFRNNFKQKCEIWSHFTIKKLVSNQTIHN